jgi:hypothetical protein
MYSWKKCIAMCLAAVALLSGVGIAQSEKTPPPQEPRSPIAQTLDEQQDIKNPQEIQLPVPNIVANRPEAQTMWEFMGQYSGSDKIRRLLNSFSNGWLSPIGSGSSCSGSMVAPHIFMTAAHCGREAGFVTFHRIDEDAAPGNGSQSQSPEYYAQPFTWQAFTSGNVQNSDIKFWWVENGSDGVPPGIKYGYLELSAAPPSIGEPVYSFWFNPINNFNQSGTSINRTLLHSSGAVVPPNGPQNFSDDNLYTAPGASGSPLIGTGPHDHQVVGVTSVGPTISAVPGNPDEGSGRRWANVRYLFDNFDSDNNEVVDAIEYDLFYMRAPRNFYDLGFTTPLRRASWIRSGASAANGAPSSVTNAPGFWVGHVVGSAGQETNDGLWHQTARFQPNATYRISMVVYGISTDASPAYIKIRSDIGRTDSLLTFTPTVGVWQRLTFRVTLGNRTDYRLILGELFDGQYYVNNIAILRESANLDFESGEERRAWEYTGRSYVTSVGLNGATDFSGMVNGASPTRWGLRNRNIALRANRTYDITCAVRHVSGSLSATNFMSVENLSGVVAKDLPWTFNSVGETRALTLTVATGNEPGNAIAFGTFGGDMKFMIDNIKIVEKP